MKKLFLLSLALGIMFVSCQNKTKSSSVHSDYTKSENGLYYKFYNDSNESETPQMMDVMDVQMACTINDTIDLIPNNRMLLQMVEPMFAGDIFEGMKMMHRGDSASFIVKTDSTFFTLFGVPSLPSEFSNDDIMKFEVKLNDFYPESELMSKQIEYMKNTYPEETKVAGNELLNYLSENGIDANPTETGLYYVKTKDGNGERPQVGTLVEVHYTGRLLDGTVFDSSVNRKEPFQFVVGIGQVIPGWDEGLMMMSKGEKGVLYIPYYLAYGDRNAGAIPPFSNLIFEVELIDF